MNNGGLSAYCWRLAGYSHLMKVVKKLIEQIFENFPIEIQTERRFIKTRGKCPVGAEWQLTKNQHAWNEISGEGEKGFVTSVRDKDANTVDYTACDFDHIFNDKGEYVNDAAREIVELALKTLPNCYCEFSQSRHGCHILTRTPDLFKQIFPEGIAAGTRGTLYFDKKIDAKLEVFLNNGGRQIVLTGNKFPGSGDGVPAGVEVESFLREVFSRIDAQNNSMTGNLFDGAGNDTGEGSANNSGDDAQNSKSKSAKKKSRVEDDDDDTEEIFKYQKNLDVAAFTKFKAENLLAKIDPAKVNGDSSWLAIMSALQNIGVAPEKINAWNARDPERYDQKENDDRLKSLKNKNFDVRVLVAEYKRQTGKPYSEKRMLQAWYRLHPEQSPNYDAALALSPELREEIFKGGRRDRDNHIRLVKLYGDVIRHTYDTDDYYYFDRAAGVWRGGELSRLYPVVVDLADRLHANAITEEEHKTACSLDSAKALAGTLNYLKGNRDIFCTKKDFDAKPLLFNAANGVLDFETGEFTPHNPEHLLTKRAPVVYDPDADSPEFRKFMEEILPDKQTRKAVLRFLGYCLTGSTKYEKALFIWGAGRNGKGTLMTVMRALLGEGDYYCTLRAETLLARKFSADPNSASPELAKTEGARVCVVDELPANGQLDVATFKKTTGGDALSVRRLRKESHTFVPQFKLILSGNFKPTLADATDAGLNERLLIVKFEKTFTNANGCDPDLKRKLTTPQNLSGILNILKEECRSALDEGLLNSEAMENEKDAYLHEADFISSFITDYCEPARGQQMTFKEFIQKLQAEVDEAHWLKYQTLSQMLQKHPAVQTQWDRQWFIWHLKWAAPANPKSGKTAAQIDEANARLMAGFTKENPPAHDDGDEAEIIEAMDATPALDKLLRTHRTNDGYPCDGSPIDPDNVPFD